MKEMKTLNGYEIVDEWAREQIGNLNGAANEPTDDKYFAIDSKGELSLKPQYRGCIPGASYDAAVSDNGVGKNGSEWHQLPKRIVLPETVEGVTVTALAKAMFAYNHAVEEIVFPDTIAVVPAHFANNAIHLRSIKNTEHITEINSSAFATTRIQEALFPRWTSNGESSTGKTIFKRCSFLQVVDIGNITEIGDECFMACQRLTTVRGGESVTTIGDRAFYRTVSLREVPFLSLQKVTGIGAQAFGCSGIQFDWSQYPDGIFADIASTPIRDNTTDYWSKTIGNRWYRPCENRLVTLLAQRNPLWADEKWGTLEETTYGGNGCSLFAAMHIHSAFSGKTYTDPRQFVSDANKAGYTDFTSTNIYDTQRYPKGWQALMEALGYSVTRYNNGDSEGGDAELDDLTDELTEQEFQEILAALADGAYAYISMSKGDNPNYGHGIVAYGVNELGEVMIADSASAAHYVNVYDDRFTYQVPLQNITGPHSQVIVVRKPTEV